MTKELVGRQLELMKRHGTEPVVVNTLQANDRSYYETQSAARVCPEEANTLKKKLLQRPTSLDSALINQMRTLDAIETPCPSGRYSFRHRTRLQTVTSHLPATRLGVPARSRTRD